MSDEITTLLKKLKDNKIIRETYFTANFLNDVGEVLEKDGFGSAQVFLIGKLERGDEARQQANALLNVVMPELVKSPRVKQKRSIGRYILKILITLKTEEVKL